MRPAVDSRVEDVDSMPSVSRGTIIAGNQDVGVASLAGLHSEDLTKDRVNTDREPPLR